MLGQPGTVMVWVDCRKVLFRDVTGFSAHTAGLRRDAGQSR
jgi:hypothetical protein